MKVEPTYGGAARPTAFAAFNAGIGIYLRRLPTLWVEGAVTELRRNDVWAFASETSAFLR